MAKEKAKNNKSFYLNLLKTALKDKEFLENKEIFEELLTRSGIDINTEFNIEQNNNFISLTLNNFDKFKYLVETHHANCHVFTSQDKFTERFSVATELLNKINTHENKFKEERKILNYLKKDKLTWLDKKINNYSKIKKEETFFELYFKIHDNEPDELKKVLNFKFDDKEKQKEFETVKNNLAINLCWITTISHLDHYYLNESLIKNVKNYLPILVKHNCVNFKDEKIDKILKNMLNPSQSLGYAKDETIDLLFIMIENGFYTKENLNELHFGEKFVQQFIDHLHQQMKESKEQNARLPSYQKEHTKKLINYDFSVFHQLMDNIESLNHNNIHTFINANQKKEIVSFIDIMLNDPIRNQKKTDDDKEKESKEVSMLKERLLLQSESVETIKSPKIKL